MIIMIIGIINSVLGLFTKLIFMLFVLVYQLFYDIANTSIAQDVMDIFGNNVYTILGVLMLFKLAFSILQYIIDPDQFANKENGMGAIVKNMFIVLALILVVPIVFDQAMNLQRIILREDIVGRVITGKNSAGVNTNQKSVGNNMAFNLVSGFVRPNDTITSCENILSSASPNYQQCLNAVKAIDSTAGSAYEKAFATADYRQLLDSDILGATRKVGNKRETLFDFNGITAILVGGFVTYVMLLFCIDIAVRSIKLSFLQIISPVPIVSYIDPKSKKKMFDGWLKTCLSTYADLFIRLGAITFAVYLIQIILTGGLQTTTTDINGNDLVTSPNIFVMIFMILGILMFAKQLPKLIEEITGIKLSGNFSLNPMHHLSEVPIAGAALGAGLGAIDAARHGGNAWEGFKRGFTTVGLGGNKKGLSDLTPMRADMLKRRTEGRNELRTMHNQYGQGGTAVGNMERFGYNIDSLDGKTKDAYIKAGYKHDDFINALMNADNESTRNKNFNAALSQAQAMGSDFHGVEVNGKTYNSIADLQKATETSNKKLKGLEATHESMRKTYAEDARLEDAIKTFKYNPSGDPTNTHTINASNDDEPQFVMLSSNSQTTTNSTQPAPTPAPTQSSGGTRQYYPDGSGDGDDGMNE